jgi:hypothetical protein
MRLLELALGRCARVSFGVALNTIPYSDQAHSLIIAPHTPRRDTIRPAILDLGPWRLIIATRAKAKKEMMDMVDTVRSLAGKKATTPGRQRHNAIPPLAHSRYYPFPQPWTDSFAQVPSREHRRLLTCAIVGRPSCAAVAFTISHSTEYKHSIVRSRFELPY